MCFQSIGRILSMATLMFIQCIKIYTLYKYLFCVWLKYYICNYKNETNVHMYICVQSWGRYF